MSVKVMAAVWDQSRSTGSGLLVLLAIADSCDHDGRNAWPAVSTIAKKTRLSERTVQRIIGQLVNLGELAVVPGPSHIRSDRRPNGYEGLLFGLSDGVSERRPATVAGRQMAQRGATNAISRGDTGVTQPVLTRPDPKQFEDNAKRAAEARRHLHAIKEGEESDEDQLVSDEATESRNQ